MISLVKLLADFIKIWYDKFKKRLEMSTINVNDGSINFGYKNIKDFTTLDSATDVKYLLATQDNNDGCKILKETLIDYIGTQGGFATQEALDTKQPLLVSGQNLKTINGVSLLDSGNITIAQGDMINDTAPSLNTVYSSSKVESVASDVFALFEDKYCINKPTDKWVEGGTGEWLSGLDYPKAWAELPDYPHKKTTETYTDYDIVVNETAQTFRLPIKPKSKIVIDSGVKGGVVGSRFRYILYSDRTIELYGKAEEKTSSRTLQGDVFFTGYYLKNDSYLSITITPFNYVDDTAIINNAPIASIGISRYINYDLQRCIGFYYKVYGYSSTDLFENIMWRASGTLDDSVQLPDTALKTYYYLG